METGKALLIGAALAAGIAVYASTSDDTPAQKVEHKSEPISNSTSTGNEPEIKAPEPKVEPVAEVKRGRPAKGTPEAKEYMKNIRSGKTGDFKWKW